jgi:hypothetical protein
LGSGDVSTVVSFCLHLWLNCVVGV